MKLRFFNTVLIIQILISSVWSNYSKRLHRHRPLYFCTVNHSKVMLCALPPCSLLYRGEGQVKHCRTTLSVLSFHSFLSAAPSLYLSPSPDLLMSLLMQSSHLSCGLDVFPPLLSLLVCLHPSLPSGLPISSCFSPMSLLDYTASQPLSSGRSSFFCPPSLFL